jgi:hypothetical protein
MPTAGAGRRTIRADSGRRRRRQADDVEKLAGAFPPSPRCRTCRTASSGRDRIVPMVRRGIERGLRVLEDHLDPGAERAEGPLPTPRCRRRRRGGRRWSAGCRPTSVRPSVVLPEPDSPTSPRAAPRGISRSTPLTISRSGAGPNIGFAARSGGDAEAPQRDERQRSCVGRAVGGVVCVRLGVSSSISVRGRRASASAGRSSAASRREGRAYRRARGRRALPRSPPASTTRPAWRTVTVCRASRPARDRG